MDLNFYQFGYVTNDFDRAKQEMIEQHGLKAVADLRGIEVSFPAFGPIRLNIGFGFAGGAQFELIEPVDGDARVYRCVLPDTGYGLRLHHISRHYSDLSELRVALREARRRWPVAMSGEMYGGEYHYFDTRDTLGHFTELSSLPLEVFPPEGLPPHRDT
ncbi:VOC family protein [Sphingobium sp. DEHP117]|uniref:VOC family protein n=1 Tax=Sphingobium sp. DEHP117 TaxID=2993436 RepID=UPI0027D72CC5|nr:VOC family protein [Sphingobium sp. DEHP117]MDQ4420388.1 VOC family protein [Sphingobium sp. DEHP117]